MPELSNKNIVKICKKHGPLTKEMASFNRKRNMYDACRKCKYNSSRKWVVINKEYTNEYQRLFRNSNPERTRIIMNRHYQKNKAAIQLRYKKYLEKNPDKKEKYRKKHREKKRVDQKKNCKELRAPYIRNLLIATGFHGSQITTELMELKRASLLLKRYIKSK